MFETLYCYESPDLYAIITSILFLNLGILGLTTNNSYLNDVNACLMLTGICSILEFSGVINDIYHIPLIICGSMIVLKLLTEMIKFWSEEYIDESEMVKSIAGEKFYRLPVSFISLLTFSYTVFAIHYYNVFLLIGLFAFILFILVVSIIKFFPKGKRLYRTTKHMLLRVTVAYILGIIGLGTSLICPSDNLLWIRFFIGTPIANASLSYAIFITAQLILLIRGSNLKRKVAIRGTPFINVAYYVGRFDKDKN